MQQSRLALFYRSEIPSNTIDFELHRQKAMDFDNNRTLGANAPSIKLMDARTSRHSLNTLVSPLTFPHSPIPENLYIATTCSLQALNRSPFMKLNLKLSLLSFIAFSLTFASDSEAMDVKRRIYDCHSMGFENATTVRVDFETHAVLGGPVSAKYFASIADGGAVVGLHHSGRIEVDRDVSPLGFEIYFNEQADFELIILERAGTPSLESPMQVRLRGQYIDVNSGKLQRLGTRWLTCR